MICLCRRIQSTMSSSVMRPRRNLVRTRYSILVAALSLVLACDVAAAANSVAPPPSLEQGFHLLYNLDFDHAHQVFLSWKRQHPEDPLGPACDAAGALFSEFNRLGVLEGQFYTDDHSFDSRKKLEPDPVLHDRFNAAIADAQARAHILLAKDPKDQNALFALTLASGLQADYAALIEKRNLASLHFTKEANLWAEQLLVLDPHCDDARVATGFSKYIVGTMSAPVRWLARLGGVSGDKAAGISELQLTAKNGRYLAPFARILLAIAYVRDKDKTRARELLSGLRDEFPGNPLFGREIARLDSVR